MGFLTTNKLSKVIDLPITLPSTEIQQSDWLVVSTVKIVEPMKLEMRFLTLSLLSASVEISSISNTNKIASSLGLAYVVLRRDYTGGDPSAAGALDSLAVSSVTTVSRNSDLVVELTTPGAYSWVLANNMKASSTSLVPTSTSINFNVSLTGAVRLYLDSGA